ncbi:MAG: tRNA uridine-5-carboxymethylaminomethyl(34) synthesis enzyme MnmG [Flavobacteriaceae bacterium]|nr:tRNA uridine-5-carboxymethylaminomethyl(34) synthesis enzyme MnmG [Flavobacteriaceae bacterium]
MFKKEYDIIVVGGGHSGAEAALSAARMGSSVLLITMNLNTIAQMSCNPAMGGIAKGQIIREIDALGGESGIISDFSAIQFRMLNRSKGPAMWSPRVQSDRNMFSKLWRESLEKASNLDFYQESVVELLILKNRLCGVITSLGSKIYSKAVILTNGTFLNGLIHIGDKNFAGGRAGESPSRGLTSNLEDRGFTSGRMKTGTPPRVDGRSLNYALMERQEGDKKPSKFSFLNTHLLKSQKPCHITYTSSVVHDILRTGFERSPMFNGRIKSIGPRYCPSIEDKINRFEDKDRHQLFVEPEGWNTIEVYVNGFSTSLPEEIQYAALKKVKGFEQVKFFRPGYAIEYDYFPPTQLKYNLETKIIDNLFFAGQINGTTGYEEAAAQGLLAGINAHLKISDQPPFVLRRDQAYIGVLIDDLITKGTDEPYRMFTSRAEYRTLLRQDNADIRLTPLSFSLGLASEERMRLVKSKSKETSKLISFFKTQSVSPEEVNAILEKNNSSLMRQSNKIYKVLSRPNISIKELKRVNKVSKFLRDESVNEASIEQAEIEIKYSGYIEKEKENAKKLTKLSHIKIPDGFNYNELSSLSSEAKEKLNTINPTNLSQASRISGIKPSDISALLVKMGR